MKKATLFILAALSLGGTCRKEADYPSPPPPSDPSYCDAAFERLKTLRRKDGTVGCRAAFTPDNKPFNEVCRQVSADGVNLRPKCIAEDTRIKTCEDVNPICIWGKTP